MWSVTPDQVDHGRQFWRMPQPSQQSPDGPTAPRSRAAVSVSLPEGGLAELVLDPTDRRTRFAVFAGDGVRYEAELQVAGERLIPYAAANNLLRHGVVLFPSAAEEYGAEAELVAAIRAHVHRYVDLSPVFEAIAAHYVLLSWLYDDFPELPYLRVRGDAGSGKTRFLLTVGSLCYKPIFASGASTVSPLFRILDAFRGTLVLDESDFRLSDEKADIVKILNNGNAQGFPVLRSEVLRSGEVNPTAYSVFGPKLIATRSFFEDRALETRCITEDLGQSGLRPEVPISVPPEMAAEALRLRNQLLMFRFRNRGTRHPAAVTDLAIEPRLRQVFAPLLGVVEDEATKESVLALARRMHQDLVSDRGLDLEAQALQSIREQMEAGGAELAIGDLARRFAARFSDDHTRPMTPKWFGWIVRRRLRLRTEKRHGLFVISSGERPKLERLFERYGIASRQEAGSAETVESIPGVAVTLPSPPEA